MCADLVIMPTPAPNECLRCLPGAGDAEQAIGAKCQCINRLPAILDNIRRAGIWPGDC
jgi:hypothetical protein